MINRKELVDILSKVRPALAKKEIIEQATHFIFTGTHITTYNDQICIIHPYPTDFQCSVRAKEFYEILNGITEDEIEIKRTKTQLKVNSERTKAGLTTVVDEKDKVDHMVEIIAADMKKAKWYYLPESFLKGMFLCMFSASKDMTTGAFTCLYGNGSEIFSSDTLRASWFIMEKDEFKPPFLLPARDVAELIKFPVTKYTVTENWMHFKTKDKVSMSVRKLEGEFPDIKPLFEIKGYSFILPSDLKNAIDSVSILAEGELDINRVVYIKVEKGKVTCKAQKERGWIEKTIDSDYDKKRVIDFTINPHFFSQVLEKTTSITVSEEKAVFTGENFKHIICLPIDEE